MRLKKATHFPTNVIYILNNEICIPQPEIIIFLIHLDAIFYTLDILMEILDFILNIQLILLEFKLCPVYILLNILLVLLINLIQIAFIKFVDVGFYLYSQLSRFEE